MFQQGIYSISYRSLSGKVAERETALAIFRDGKILGSDSHGGVFSGTIRFDGAQDASKVDLKIDVPPGGTLITGYSAGIDGETIDIAGLFTTPNPASKAVVNVAGGQVEVELSYLGPLPD